MSAKRKADIVFESGLPLDKFSIQWKIRNFSAYLSDYLTCTNSESDERVLRSRDFSSNSGHKWRLLMNKWEHSTRDKTQEIGLWIILLSTHESMVNVNTECSLTIDGKKHATKTNHSCNVANKKPVILLRTREEELLALLNKPNSENVADIELDIEVWSEETITVTHGTSSENTERFPKKNDEIVVRSKINRRHFAVPREEVRSPQIDFSSFESSLRSHVQRRHQGTSGELR